MSSNNVQLYDWVVCQGLMFQIHEVISACWYGEADGWYIEFRDEDGRYHYWKQGQDGGKLFREITSAEEQD